MALPHHSSMDSFSKPMNLATKLGHQEDKYKIRRGTTGGLVFFNLSHGSSQELSFGMTLFLHIHGGGLYTVAQLGQCPGHPFPDIY